MIRVLYFGRLSEVAAAHPAEVCPPPDVTSLAELRRWLCRDDARLRAALNQPSVRTVDDGAVVLADMPLDGVDEVAFLPPVSGG